MTNRHETTPAFGWPTMNKAQQISCKLLWERWAPPETYQTFRRRFFFIHEGSGNGYFFGLMPGGSLHIGIEHDGYAHS